MLAPITPHFCSELWAGLLSAHNRLCENSKLFDWKKNVLEQSWPVVDEHYGLSFLCKVSNRICIFTYKMLTKKNGFTFLFQVDGMDKCHIKMTSSELLHLNEEKALQIMLNQESVQKSVKRGILSNRFELYPDCRAILNIFTKKVQKQLEQQIILKQ